MSVRPDLLLLPGGTISARGPNSASGCAASVGVFYCHCKAGECPLLSAAMGKEVRGWLGEAGPSCLLATTFGSCAERWRSKRLVDFWERVADESGASICSGNEFISS